MKNICFKLDNMILSFSLLFLMNEKVIYAISENLNMVYYLGSILAFVYTLYRLRTSVINDKFIILIVISQLWIFFSNCWNGATYLTCIRIINVISLTLLSCSELVRNKTNYIKVLKNTLFLVTIIDQVLVLLQIYVFNLNQVGGYGLFLHKNSHVIMYMAYLIIQWYDEKNRTSNISKKFIGYAFFCLVISIFSLKAVSSSIALIVLLLLMVFEKKLFSVVFFRKYYNIFSLYLLEIVMFFSFVIFRIHSGIISFILTIILHRELNFTGRIDMWDSALNNIKNLPILGFGDDILFGFAVQGRFLTNNCHNYILHLLMSGGYFYIFLVSLIFLCCYVRMRNYILSIEAKMILFFITVNMIMGVSEIMVTMSNLIFPFLAMGVTIKKWISSGAENEC